MNAPIVAIVGRPNVGKSSLFNRFLRRRLAVVDSVSGVTRDRNYSICEWAGREFMLVDTGGMVPETRDQMERLIYDQSDFAINEADLVLFVVDTHVGVNTIDVKIARQLNKSGCPVVLVANKVDNDNFALDVHEFYKLGLGEPLPVSAVSGRGTGDLLDAVVDGLPDEDEAESEDEGVIRVALVGRPNVGKSSLINKLLGQDRLIVSPVAGTTRDSVDTPITIDDRRYILVDTAGLRRKYKVHENIEFFTSLRTMRAIDRCDVAVVMVDAQDLVTAQDQHVLSQVLESRRAAVLAVNKWDLIEKDSKTADQYSLEIKDKLAKFSYLPLIYISALSGQRATKVLDLVDRVHAEHHKRIPTSELNDFLAKAVGRRKPPARRGKFIQIKYITQSEVAPPTFIMFANHPQLIDKAYISYLSNQIRASFGFEGVPIRLKFRKK